MLNVIRDEEEISTLEDRCRDAEAANTSQYPGMTYEQGIIAVLEWLRGDMDDNPLE